MTDPLTRMNFIDKKILIISTEKWGTNQVSKHHYALTLAEHNTVFFLNPNFIGQKKTNSKELSQEGIIILNYSPIARGVNRLMRWAPWLANIVMRVDIWRLKKIAQTDFDVIWSFDPFRFQNLRLFNSALKIFHPVDYFNTDLDQINAKTADIIFSVSKPILERYCNIPTPAFFINHGVSHYFLKRDYHYTAPDNKIKCGYVGNLLSYGIHHSKLLEIIADNPNIEFHFIGPTHSSNLGKSLAQGGWTEKLSSFDNVIVHGELHPQDVALKIVYYDVFLICYDVEKVGKLASNNHKLLEFLSTGKTVVSSYTSTYDSLGSDLFEMVKKIDELPNRFKYVVANIEQLNSISNQEKRKEFAFKNSYSNHLIEIETLIQKNLKYVV